MDLNSWLQTAVLAVLLCILIAVIVCLRSLSAFWREQRVERETHRKLLLSNFSDILVAIHQLQSKSANKPTDTGSANGA